MGWKEFGCGISDMRFVCPRTFVNSTRTAGPIVTWHRSTHQSAGTMMVLIWGQSAARGTWHVPPRQGLLKNSHAPTGQTVAAVARGTCRRVKVYQKFFEQPYRSHGASETRRSHAYCTNLKSIGGAVSVGCQLHAPGGEEAVLSNSALWCTLAMPTLRRMK